MTIQGNCIRKIVMTDHTKTIRLDVSEVPAGLYFIRVTTTDSRIVKKVVVMH